MADKIVDPNNYNWSREPANKGKTKYLHLLDGNAREINILDYGYENPVNFRNVLLTTARAHNLKARSKVLDGHTVIFQVIGIRDGE